MRAKELKEYLLEDPDRILKVLRVSGFHDFKVTNQEIRCALPDMENPTGVMIRLNELLYTSLFEINFNGDLYGALSRVLDMDFKEVVIYIHSVLGITTKGSKSIIDPLKQLKSLSRGVGHSSANENKLYNETILNQFVFKPHKYIIEEGITSKVSNQFHVCYDPVKDRIVFPHYDWTHTDKIVGMQGRTTQTKEEMAITGTPKYWNYIRNYRKVLNLYGYNISKNYITDKIILFEGEKSVLKHFTYCNGKGYSVALGGHNLSTEQIEFLLREQPDTEVVLAFDKDVMTKEEEGLNFIIEQAKRFKPFGKVSYIYDEHNLLDEKDSPIDKGKKVWDYLLKWRKRV